MNDLVEFLRGRLDDDEQVALAASPGPWHPNAESDEVVAVDEITVCDGFALSGNQLRATVQHIVRHDPARVLAEVEAKRAIIEECEPGFNPPNAQAALTAETVLRSLALPYADHDDYREEWRP